MRASYAPKSLRNPRREGGIPVAAIVVGAAAVGVVAYLFLRSRNARPSPQFHPAVVGSGLQGIGFFSGGGGGRQSQAESFTPPPPSTVEPPNIYGGSSGISYSDLAPVSP